MAKQENPFEIQARPSTIKLGYTSRKSRTTEID